MARTFSQADRVECERQHGVVSAPAVVDRYYRLQPTDLGGANSPPHTVVVRLVGAQGFEQPLPLLHLAGLAKPLVLDSTNVAALTRLAASPLQRDWVGREIVLAVVSEDNGLVIRLFAPEDPQIAALHRRSRRVARAQAAAAWLRRLLHYSLLLLVLLILVLAAVYLMENWSTVVELATALLDGMLNP